MVRAGYKQTKVGTIPEDWDVYKTGDFDPFITSGSRGWAQYYSKEGDLFIRITNLTRDSIYLDLSDCRFVKLPPGVSEGKRTELQNGDLLISITADIGIIGYMDDSVPKPAYINQHISLVRLNPNDVNPKFVAYFLASEDVQRLFRGATDQGAKAGLNLDSIRNLQFAFPPHLEQCEIAQALSDVDALIEGLDKLIAKKRAVKQAAMQQLLTGKTRLPGFGGDGNGRGYKQTEIGLIPEDWNVATFNEIGQSFIGLTYKPENVRESGTLVLRSSNIQNGRLAFSDNVYVDMALPQRVIVEKGDILVCVRNGSRQLIGKSALIDHATEGSAFGAFMSIFRTNHSKFVFYQFQSDIIQRQISEMMGATINQITNKNMASFKIPLPTNPSEEKAIASILSEMDAEIAALETRRAKTQAIKQGMMQELLTGRTRLL